jgi:hypothetical protein
MNIDRKPTLARRSIAKRAMNDLDLSENVRARAKRIVDQADVLLGMQDAEARGEVEAGSAQGVVSQTSSRVTLAEWSFVPALVLCCSC